MSTGGSNTPDDNIDFKMSLVPDPANEKSLKKMADQVDSIQDKAIKATENRVKKEAGLHEYGAKKVKDYYANAVNESIKRLDAIEKREQEFHDAATRRHRARVAMHAAEGRALVGALAQGTRGVLELAAAAAVKGGTNNQTGEQTQLAKRLVQAQGLYDLASSHPAILQALAHTGTGLVARHAAARGARYLAHGATALGGALGIGSTGVLAGGAAILGAGAIGGAAAFGGNDVRRAIGETGNNAYAGILSTLGIAERNTVGAEFFGVNQDLNRRHAIRQGQKKIDLRRHQEAAGLAYEEARRPYKEQHEGFDFGNRVHTATMGQGALATNRATQGILAGDYAKASEAKRLQIMQQIVGLRQQEQSLVQRTSQIELQAAEASRANARGALRAGQKLTQASQQSLGQLDEGSFARLQSVISRYRAQGNLTGFSAEDRDLLRTHGGGAIREKIKAEEEGIGAGRQGTLGIAGDRTDERERIREGSDLFTKPRADFSIGSTKASATFNSTMSVNLSVPTADPEQMTNAIIKIVREQLQKLIDEAHPEGIDEPKKKELSDAGRRAQAANIA